MDTQKIKAAKELLLKHENSLKKIKEKIVKTKEKIKKYENEDISLVFLNRGLGCYSEVYIHSTKKEWTEKDKKKFSDIFCYDFVFVEKKSDVYKSLANLKTCIFSDKGQHYKNKQDFMKIKA